MNFKLEQTCFACPEQYDVYLDGEQVGYLRLRHGYFRADFPDCGGKTVYTANPNGDGMFDYDEREYYINEALKAIAKELEGAKKTLYIVVINGTPNTSETHKIKEFDSKEDMDDFIQSTQRKVLGTAEIPLDK